MAALSKIHSLSPPLVTTLFALATPTAAQTPIDLATWTAESYPAVAGFGNGQWAVDPTGNSVFQSVNGQPTLFYSDFEATNLRIEGELEVSPAGDDDLIGFAIGFQPGDSANPNADYLLVDWKAASQSFNFSTPSCTPGGLSPRGLAVSRVRGIPTADEFWTHTNLDMAPCSSASDSVIELARATNLGSTGWMSNRSYRFRFDFTPTRLDVAVDGNPEISISGQFTPGRIAFYNFSQANVTYRAFTSDCPASSSLYGQGHPGTMGVPSIGTNAAPVLGTQIDIQLGNVAPTATFAALIFGLAPLDLPTGLGGNLLVQPAFSPTIQLPLGGTSTPFNVPPGVTLCGVGLYLQQVQVDPGASAGLAFSRGLELVVGM